MMAGKNKQKKKKRLTVPLSLVISTSITHIK